MILATNFCQETQSAWKIVGTLLLVVKIFSLLGFTSDGISSWYLICLPPIHKIYFVSLDNLFGLFT